MPETAISPPSRLPPTPRQARILQFILDYTLEHGYQPSMREIQVAMGYSSTTNAIICHLDALIRKGYLGPRHQQGHAGGGGTARSLKILRLPDGSPFRGFALK